MNVCNRFDFKLILKKRRKILNNPQREHEILGKITKITKYLRKHLIDNKISNFKEKIKTD